MARRGGFDLSALPESVKARQVGVAARALADPDAAASRAAAWADAAGKAFEAWIDAQHERAVAEGRLAYGTHVGPPVRFEGPGKAVPVGYGGADWLAHTLDDITFVTESKSTLGNFPRSHLLPHQAQHLDAHSLGQGLALLLVEFRSECGAEPIRAAVPWREVPWVRRGAGQSLAPGDVEKWRLVADELYFERALASHRAARRGTPR